jgi:thiamine transporter ThiT
MQNVKNIGVGFLVSFIGSIPLGYLNVVGFQVYQKSELQPTIEYLLGVISIEFFVIFFTLIFANRLAANKKLTKYIEGFSVLFMFLLAAIFYFGSNSKEAISNSFDYAPFVLGMVLSCLNFIQIPFWTGWNLWLLNGKYIEVSGARKYGYVFGTIVGTFSGMLTLILSLHYFSTNVDFLSKYLMQIIIPLVFLGLGIFQGIKFYGKYFR